MKKKPLTEEEETRRGKWIAQALNLKLSKDFPDRYNTQWGTKTALGLFRSVKRIVEEGE